MPNPSVQSQSHLTLVNNYLDAYLSRKISAAREIHPRYETLWQEIARVAGAGKRLRPQILLMSYEAFGGTEPSRVIPAAVACELLHISMLVHDDIIDRDLIRHNQPTIQSSYLTRYADEVADLHLRQHNALSTALLAGDLLLNEARSLMTKAAVPASVVRRASYAFDEAVFSVAGGELLDVESAATVRGAVDPIIVMTHKTANYSFIAPLVIGAVLARASLSDQKAVRSFGLNLGIAYQLTDDLLGVFGQSNITGKSTSGDIREGKSTFLVERFYALATAEQVAEFGRLYGNKEVNMRGCDRVRLLLQESGALAETERSVKSYADAARYDLELLELDEPSHAAFSAMIDRCTDRSA